MKEVNKFYTSLPPLQNHLSTWQIVFCQFQTGYASQVVTIDASSTYIKERNSVWKFVALNNNKIGFKSPRQVFTPSCWQRFLHLGGFTQKYIKNKIWFRCNSQFNAGIRINENNFYPALNWEVHLIQILISSKGVHITTVYYTCEAAMPL